MGDSHSPSLDGRSRDFVSFAQLVNQDRGHRPFGGVSLNIIVRAPTETSSTPVQPD